MISTKDDDLLIDHDAHDFIQTAGIDIIGNDANHNPVKMFHATNEQRDDNTLYAHNKHIAENPAVLNSSEGRQRLGGLVPLADGVKDGKAIDGQQDAVMAKNNTLNGSIGPVFPILEIATSGVGGLAKNAASKVGGKLAFSKVDNTAASSVDDLLLNPVPKDKKAVANASDEFKIKLGPEENLIPDNSSTTLSQAGGLNATEGARVVKPNGKLTKPTHPLERHGPDVSDQFVIDRVQKELVDKGRTGIRTKFNDRSVMESTIADTIQANRNAIDEWLASKPKTGVPKAFEHNPGIGNLGTGFETSKAGNGVVKVNKPLENINLVLIPDGKGDFLIHTAHPF